MELKGIYRNPCTGRAKGFEDGRLGCTMVVEEREIFGTCMGGHSYMALDIQLQDLALLGGLQLE